MDELIYVNNKGKDENHKLIMKIHDQKVYKQALIKIANKCYMKSTLQMCWLYEQKVRFNFLTPPTCINRNHYTMNPNNNNRPFFLIPLLLIKR